MSEQENKQQFLIHKIYSKDISFESPVAPSMFKSSWKPESNVDLNISHKALENNNYEVELILTLTTKNDNQECYICEITQTGLFEVNVPEEQLGGLLGSFCPNILFPYAKELISNLVVKSGYPIVQINPVNFDALYAQTLEKAQNNGSTEQPKV
jgi:preprotein translocase subunit SecB